MASASFPGSFPQGFAARPEETAVATAGPGDIGLPLNVSMLRDAQYLIRRFDLEITNTGDPVGTILDQRDVEDPGLMQNNMRIDRQGFHDYKGKRYCRYAVQTGGRTLASLIVRVGVVFSVRLHRHAFLLSMYRGDNIWLGR